MGKMVGGDTLRWGGGVLYIGGWYSSYYCKYEHDLGWGEGGWIMVQGVGIVICWMGF
jgi:hypothetical protein